MKIPARLIPLVEDGIIDEVLGQVKSGKEADVFIVRFGDELRCAKVYKEANNRSFRQAVQYQEGRKVQNSRSARAMSKRTRYGQKEAEASWINAEVEALNTLSAAGLRVPRPFGFFDGVLIMELIVGEDGEPAPRLNDIALTPEIALLYHEELIAQIVRMLCAGIIHGDLSEFNVLVDAEGPVIIDLPQAVNAAGNNSAAMMFARDVDNMARYFGRFEPGILGLKYAKEIWDLYEKGKLTPHVELTGQFKEPTKAADVGGVLNAIGDARKEHEDRILKKAKDREEGPSRFIKDEEPRGRDFPGDARDPRGAHREGRSGGQRGGPRGPHSQNHQGNPGTGGGQRAANPQHAGQSGQQRPPDGNVRSTGSQGNRHGNHNPPNGNVRQGGPNGNQRPPEGNVRHRGQDRNPKPPHQSPPHRSDAPPRANPGNDRNPPAPPKHDWGRRPKPGGNPGRRSG
ncbi:MAG: PA4780 family RIO1-like protein kinase [Fibrobacteria bacterium]